MEFSLRKGFVVINFEEIYDIANHIKLLNDVSGELRREYDNSNYEFNSSTFLLQNTMTRQRCSINPSNIIIEYDSLGGIEPFYKLALSTLKVLHEKGILNRFSRIGFRTFWGKDYDSIQDADDVLIKCFKFDPKIIGKFGNGDNLRYGFISHEEIYSINYNFASAINKEIKIHNGKQVSEEEKYCIINDIDIFIDKDCKYSSIFTYMNNFSEITKKKLEIFEDMIKGV